MSRAILVTGATGKQGGAVVDALLALPNADFTILAVTRNPQSTDAKRLASRSSFIKLVGGNLNDTPALFEEAHQVSAHPIWGVYSLQVSIGPGVTVASEVAQGKNLIDAAIQNGVSHFVYSSIERGGDEVSWDNPTPIPHFQSKYQIERHLRDVTGPGKPGEKMRWTILRPVAFMDNLESGFQTKVFLAALQNWLGNKPLQFIATSDIGIFAAKAFDDPEGWDRRAVGLAGDELSVRQISESFLNATGSPAPITYWFLGSALTYAITEVRLMIGWFASAGYKADIHQIRREHADLLTMEQWLVRKSGLVTR
ncbi:uncharacterized protein BCR38DRAFT_334802 [Pseudomassariella vexata]|uniref:NmrA-like domain-containing protein n=1 Tax=Pseudomassariella vexata TaxID=1141098 RepID=A0A1Y2EAE3_9PEZI|nr:uncharacterized protein BCR38DRAFT_334802 [Pseudomassariella vexata]ORY68558.1 hypothetical protein BCR38DRAFT_334802 [Pseudomassariella vexata]